MCEKCDYLQPIETKPETRTCNCGNDIYDENEFCKYCQKYNKQFEREHWWDNFNEKHYKNVLEDKKNNTYNLRKRDEMLADYNSRIK